MSHHGGMWNSWGLTPDIPCHGPPGQTGPTGSMSQPGCPGPISQLSHTGHASHYGQNGQNGHGHSQNGHRGHPQVWSDLDQGCVPPDGVFESFESFAYPRVGPVPLPQRSPDVADEPQIQWWVDKIDAGGAIERGCKSRSVGSMCPTNLGKAQTLRVSDRKDTTQRGPGRAKFASQSLLPDVPRPLRHPSEIGAAIPLCKLEKTQGWQGNEIRAILRESFHKAYEAVNKAAKAHEDLCQRTEKLKGIPGTLDAVKRAKICTRDVLLWRWFGLTAWIYNQAESEFFQSYGREIESQLMNSVVKIRQRLMQDLMRKPCWSKLEKKLVSCAATDSFTPELQGLLNRFRFMFESLGGPGNPVLQEWRLSEEEKKLEMEEHEAKEREAEQEFEAEVWNNAGRKVSESVVGLLGLDDFDDFDDFDPSVDPDCQKDTIHPIDASPEGDIAGRGFVDGLSSIQDIFWELQHPKAQVSSVPSSTGLTGLAGLTGLN